MKYLCLYFLTWRLLYDHLFCVKTNRNLKKIIKNLTFKDLKAGADNAYCC